MRPSVKAPVTVDGSPREGLPRSRYSPPGQPKLEGSDASHAWTSVLVPGGEWIDLDPTNDHFADSRYIVTAWGRDFRDVSPLKGVVFTEAKKSSLEVKVDVFRVNADGTLS